MRPGWKCKHFLQWWVLRCLLKLSFHEKHLEHRSHIYLFLCWECICVCLFMLPFSENAFKQMGHWYRLRLIKSWVRDIGWGELLQLPAPPLLPITELLPSWLNELLWSAERWAWCKSIGRQLTRVLDPAEGANARTSPTKREDTIQRTSDWLSKTEAHDQRKRGQMR